MAAGGRDFERALGALLTFDVGEIGPGAAASRIFGCGRDSTCVPLKWLASWMSDEAATISMSGLAHAASGPHAAGQINPSPRALAPMAAGRTPATGAIEPSRPSSPRTANPDKRVMGNGADRGHQAKRDRQVVMAALLGQIGGREVDRDPSRRQGEPGSDHRRAHSLARLRNRLVGKADDGEGRHAGRDLYLETGLTSMPSNATVVTRWTMPEPRPRITLPELGIPARTFRERNMVFSDGSRSSIESSAVTAVAKAAFQLFAKAPRLCT